MNWLPAALLLLAGMGQTAMATCAPDVVELRQGSSAARFKVEIADDEAERARGLMDRRHLPASAGMLFLYDPPQPVAFWMRNTLIPLDMVFLDAEGVVVRVHENARPLDETPIPGGEAVRAVLEINGGLARRLGVTPGAQMRHPAFGAIAAWPCD